MAVFDIWGCLSVGVVFSVEAASVEEAKNKAGDLFVQGYVMPYMESSIREGNMTFEIDEVEEISDGSA